ncbi:MAG: hypothetical protein F7B95_04045 [Desulfurococcales archaeon]|nr:hypothetical protein [Desulfurococcales archaeon]
MKVAVNHGKAVELGKIIGSVLHHLSVDDFTDTRFYPPASASREEVASYFLVMVAMDHRLSRPGKPYEGYVDGEFYHGADLLYRLGMKKFNEDPGFFTAERLSRVTSKEVIEWLSIENPERGTVKPPDPQLRAELLRDLGIKLLKLYDGSAYNIIVRSRGYLRRDAAEGFIDLLKVFKAYQDPVEKKAFLLAKFLERRGILIIQDQENKEVPVDNHLVRIAVRLGIVDLDTQTLEKIALGEEFSWEEDVFLRIATRTAYKLLALSAGVDPFILDDFLWLFGRKCCLREKPVCRAKCYEACGAIGGCREGLCVFEKLCTARRDARYMVNEHTYLNTWYY